MRSAVCARRETINSAVCVDASLLIKVPVPEELSDEATALSEEWIKGSTQLFAPSLLKYEFVSILRHKILSGHSSEEEARAALEFAFQPLLTIVSSDDIHIAAQRLANDFGLSSTYDAHYIAVAEELGCELWTADARLHTAIVDRFPLIRLLGA